MTWNLPVYHELWERSPKVPPYDRQKPKLPSEMLGFREIEGILKAIANETEKERGRIIALLRKHGFESAADLVEYGEQNDVW